jgi:acetoin utilization deacetylase AcuC-like enzyme
MTVAHIPLVYADPTGFAHDTGPGHPEHGGRLRAVMATLDVLAAEGRARVATAGPVDDELLGLVHPAAYVELVGRHSASGEPLDYSAHRVAIIDFDVPHRNGTQADST